MEFAVILFLVAAFYLSLTLAGTRKRNTDASKHPEEVDDDVPEKCKSLMYCTHKPKNYPEEEFNNMYTGNVIKPASAVEVSFENRLGDAGQENGCKSIVEVDDIYQVRRSINDRFQFVIHFTKEKHFQRVRRERCPKPEANCFTTFGDVPGLITYCHQENTAYNFTVKELIGHGTEEIEVELPICCSCRYKLRSDENLLNFSSIKTRT